MVNKRYINIYRGLAIILMVISRFPFLDPKIAGVIYSFNVAMFFVAGGVDFAGLLNPEKIETDKEIGYYASTYLKAYGWFRLITIVIQAILLIFGADNLSVDSILWMVMDNCCFFGISVLWILPALFIGQTIYGLLRRKLNNILILFILSTLIALYIAFNGIALVESAEEDGLILYIATRLFIVVWRGVLGAWFVCLGNILSGLAELFHKKRGIGVPLGFLLVGLGIVSAYFNDISSFGYLSFGNPFLFFGAAVSASAGFLLLCEWIGQSEILEFFGKSFMVIMLTHLDFRIMHIGTVINDNVLIWAENRFVAHLCMIIFVLIVELILIALFYNYFYFLLGCKKWNPYGFLKKRK